MPAVFACVLLFFWPLGIMILSWLLLWDGHYFYPAKNLMLGLAAGGLTLLVNAWLAMPFWLAPRSAGIGFYLGLVSTHYILVPVAAMIGKLAGWVFELETPWPALGAAILTLLHVWRMGMGTLRAVLESMDGETEQGATLQSSEALRNEFRDVHRRW
jgi:hypothetical protein